MLDGLAIKAMVALRMMARPSPSPNLRPTGLTGYVVISCPAFILAISNSSLGDLGRDFGMYKSIFAGVMLQQTVLAVYRAIRPRAVTTQ